MNNELTLNSGVEINIDEMIADNLTLKNPIIDINKKAFQN
jgi:hypothetical protein